VVGDVSAAAVFPIRDAPAADTRTQRCAEPCQHNVGAFGPGRDDGDTGREVAAERCLGGQNYAGDDQFRVDGELAVGKEHEPPVPVLQGRHEGRQFDGLVKRPVVEGDLGEGRHRDPWSIETSLKTSLSTVRRASAPRHKAGVCRPWADALEGRPTQASAATAVSRPLVVEEESA
jgi:hypothetical protein